MSEQPDDGLPEAYSSAVAEAKAVRKPRAAKAVSTDILSEEDIQAAKDKAAAEVFAERRKAEIKRIMEEEKERLRRENAGMTEDEIMNEEVFVTIDLAEHSAHIMLDGMVYHHGQTYKVRRAVANTIHDIMFRGHVHQDQVEGKDRNAAYRRTRNMRAA